jgi:hypothetical protein
MVQELRTLEYFDQWRLIRTNGWFSVMLEDLSIFVFSDLDGKPSYSFLPCPLQIDSITDFLRSLDLEPTKRNKAEYSEEYEDAIITAELKRYITPIRYDIDLKAYKCNIHPSAHLHFGLDNSIRLATRKILDPTAFVLFVLRQHYPLNFERLLVYSDQLKLSHRIRSGLPLVEADYWKPQDELQSYLI